MRPAVAGCSSKPPTGRGRKRHHDEQDHRADDERDQRRPQRAPRYTASWALIPAWHLSIALPARPRRTKTTSFAPHSRSHDALWHSAGDRRIIGASETDRGELRCP